MVFLNAAAERLTRRCSGLSVKRDRLCAELHADTVRLERLTKDVTGIHGRRPIGGAVTIYQAVGEQPLQVSGGTAAAGHWDRASEQSGERSPCSSSMIRASRAMSRKRLIGSMFGLTPAEAQLLLALNNGQTLKQFCDEHDVTHNTARTHLRSVFAKTRTSKQSDLVRLMSGLTHSL